MRIGFDAKRLFNNFTGLGNYSRFIVSALHEHYPQDEYYLFTPRIKKNPDTIPFLDRSHFQTILPSPWVTNLKLGSFWRSFLVGRYAEKEGVDLYHGLSHELPNNIPAKIKKVVTIHDLIFIRYPQFYNAIDVLIYKTKVLHACRTADRIIAISEQTARDIVNYLHIPESKIDVVFQGCHPNFKRKCTTDEINLVKLKYGLPSKYILNVGTIEERKNATAIVKAYAQLSSSARIPVVFVGKKTNYINKILDTAKAAGVEKDMIFVNHAEFQDLPAIYQGSSVFVYPSLFEGFGIPLIEAVESGIPVITSRDSCFSEAAGPASIYIDPHRPEELATQLEKVLSDKNLANQMVTSSAKYIARFQPPVIAKALHDVYDKVLRS